MFKYILLRNKTDSDSSESITVLNRRITAWFELDTSVLSDTLPHYSAVQPKQTLSCSDFRKESILDSYSGSALYFLHFVHSIIRGLAVAAQAPLIFCQNSSHPTASSFLFAQITEHISEGFLNTSWKLIYSPDGLSAQISFPLLASLLPY